MKFRFLVAVLAVVVGGAAIFGGRATTSQAVTGGSITLSCPAVVLQGGSFTCSVGLGTMPDPVTGYQFVLIYDSPTSTPTAGTFATVTSIVNNYSAAAVWGGLEFCPADVMNASNPLLPPGWVGSGHGCVSLANPAPAAAIPNMVSFNFTANGLGSFPVHMVTLGEGGASFGSFTIDGSSAPHENTYVCVGVLCVVTPALDVDPHTTNGDPIVTVVLPPADVSLTKTGSVPSLVQSQSMTFTLTAMNNSTTSAAPAVVVTDTVPAAFTIGVLPAGCTAVLQVVTCTAASVPALGSVSFVIPVTASSGAGTTVSNCASETNSSVPADPNPANNTNICASVTIIPPAVAWSKSPANQQVFLCEGGVVGVQGCTANGLAGTVSFQEIMTNQGDPNGLGAFQFTLHFDNSVFNVPVLCGINVSICPTTGSFVDISPAWTLFNAAGRNLVCTMTIPQETQIQVACASTGPIGTGPVWVGPQVMANVTMQVKDFVRASLFPHKENGIISRFDDTGTEPANTCGQPLNDGTGFVVPGQTTECQGVALLGILPGGLVADSHAFVTIRRLEGDVNKDCSVTVADMQAEATRYGFGTGSLLYNLWYDLEPHTTGADGDIDIKDVQFVFGRFGSECTAPIPPQVMQTPPDP
jgi:uncharacterized repeat protein (TIGR01451 family)